MILNIQIKFQSVIMAFLKPFFHKSQFEKSLIFHFSNYVNHSIWMIYLKIAHIIAYLLA